MMIVSPGAVDARSKTLLPIYPIRQQPQMIVRIMNEDNDDDSIVNAESSASLQAAYEKRHSHLYDTVQQLLVLDRLLDKGRRRWW